LTMQMYFCVALLKPVTPIAAGITVAWSACVLLAMCKSLG